jgi:protein involved in polysaccharide export with SLBB domain
LLTGKVSCDMKKDRALILVLSLFCLPLSLARAQTDNAAMPSTKQAVTRPRRVQEGEQTAKQVAAKNAEAAKFYYKLGEEWGRAKQYYEASKFFRRALMYKPDYADAYYGLGHAYADMGRWQEAIEAYQQVLRIDPKDEQTYQRLGEAYVKLHAPADPRPRPDGTHNIAPVAAAVPVVVTPEAKHVAIVQPTPQPAAAPRVEKAKTETAKSTTRISSNAGAKDTAAKIERLGPAAPRVEAAHAADGGAMNHAVKEPETKTPDPTSYYHVGPGDVLEIHLLNAPTQTQSTLFNIQDDGTLIYPLAGAARQVAGLTTDEIASWLQSAPLLRTLTAEPRLSVGVHEYASHTINIEGLVNDPGEKVLRREAIPLYVVLAAAQARPEAGRVRIDNPSAKRHLVYNDLTAQEVQHDLIYPGDHLIVEAKPDEMFTIVGLVAHPGKHSFHPGLTLTQAVLLAGDLKADEVKTKAPNALPHTHVSASERANYYLIVTRDSKEGRATPTMYQLEKIESGKVPDPPLQARDRVNVVRK